MSTGERGSAIGGVGIGWRQEIDLTIDRFSRGAGVDFVEFVAENVHPGHVPATLAALHERARSADPARRLAVARRRGPARPREARPAGLAGRTVRVAPGE